MKRTGDRPTRPPTDRHGPRALAGAPRRGRPVMVALHRVDTVPRPYAFAVFLLVLLAAFGGMHWFLWVRLARDTALPDFWRRAIGVFLAVAAASVPVAIVIVRRLPFRTARTAAGVLFTWMGASFLLFTALLATDLARVVWLGVRWLVAAASGYLDLPADPTRRVFVARTLAGGALFAAAGATAAAVEGAIGDPRVKEVPVKLERLPPALSGFTLAQITDLHVGPTIREKHVRRIVDMTNAMHPDAVVITGDLVDGTVAELRKATEHLARLRAPHGVYFVTGNHDYYSGARAWLAEVARYGIRPLRNERVVVGDAGPGGASFDLAGIDDWSVARIVNDHWPSLDAALAGRHSDRSLVLLAHQPRGVAEAIRAGVELQLSGHTHGGQIFPWNVVVGAVYPYYKGLYHHAEGARNGQVYVSCGTGYWGPPMRLGAPAEVTRIVLTT
jgi:predicted MPP superfamily phosphohydrolase